jgi:hypothetical protein
MKYYLSHHALELSLWALVLVATLGLVVTLPSCDEDDEARVSAALEEIAPVVVDAVIATQRDPAVLDAYATDGWSGIRETGGKVLIANLKNSALHWAESDDKLERTAYELIHEYGGETLALMVSRNDNTEGLWPRLLAWMHANGYTPTLLGVLEISAAEREELIDLLPQVGAEELAAVRALQKREQPAIEGFEEWQR